jgi:uncharacterized protein (TIGR01244 family)
MADLSMSKSSPIFALLAALLTVTVAGGACAQPAAVPGSDAAAFIQGVTGHGQPDEQTLEQINAAGYAAVIDLRGPDEDRGLADERAAVEGLGMSYIALPIVGADAINFDNANELDRLLAQFDKPVFVHCGSGNRAGAMLALRAKLNGAEDETALEAGRETGLKGLEDVVRQRLQER